MMCVLEHWLGRMNKLLMLSLAGGALLLASSCSDSVVDDFNPKNRVSKLPNLAVESYVSENPTKFCGEKFALSDVLKSVADIGSENNKKAEFYLRMGMCFAMAGKEEMASFYMMRAVHYSDLVEVDGKAKKIALSYLIYQEDYSRIPFSKSNVVDAAWACEILLRDGISMYSYRGVSQELSDLRCQVLLKQYKQSNSAQKIR